MESKKTVFIIAFLLMISISGWLQGALKKELQDIAMLYEKGEADKIAVLLNKATSTTDDEKAFILYYKALISPDADKAKQNLRQLCDIYPKTQFCQSAYLELGHLYLLDRDYTEALVYFKKITSPDFPQKHYWIAQTYYQQADYQNAISSAEQYLRFAKPSDEAEDISFLIADAYIEIKQYNNAINTLKKMNSIGDKQYYHYRYGFAQEMLGSKTEALSHYQIGFEADRYSQLAYLIEDRLFDLRDRNRTEVDLSFLYPYSDSPLPDIVLATPIVPAEPVENVKQPEIAPIAPKQSKQLDAPPKSGIFLQAGRFSKLENAAKLSDKIAALDLTGSYYKATGFKDVSWVVVCGPFKTEQEAIDARDKLKTSNIDCFIIQR
jgi:tetratricopeptide (TPR) repeat protein